jgi:nucleotide-binding universal stress UspA family protein
MSTQAGNHVLVGVDGSECSLAAVRAAAAEAASRGRPLRIVHAFIWPMMHVAVGPAAGGPPSSGLRYNAEQMLSEAAAEALKEAPDLSVETALVDGAAVPVLLHESRHAALLVLGDRGLGGFTGLIVGSVAVQAAAHAACPVLVIRGAERRAGPVVVGVDGSPVSTLALEFAAEAAARLGAELAAVHTWQHPVSTGAGDMLPLVYDAERLETEEGLLLAECTAGLGERYPDLVVHRHLERGRPGHHLVEWSRRARLLVVGARGRGGFTGLLLGSVSQAVLHHSACPVAIVRAMPTPAPADR